MDELASIGLMPEKWGGDVPVVQVSALKGDNVDELLETVMLVAEPFETYRRALWKGYVQTANIEERAETEPLVLLIEYAVWWGFHSGDVMHTNCSLQVLNIFGCGNCMYGWEDRLVTPPKSHQNVAVRSIPFLHVSSKLVCLATFLMVFENESFDPYQELLKALIGFIDVAGLYFALTQLTHRNISQNHKFQAVGLGEGSLTSVYLSPIAYIHLLWTDLWLLGCLHFQLWTPLSCTINLGTP